MKVETNKKAKGKVEIDGKIYEMELPSLKHSALLEEIVEDMDAGKIPAKKMITILVELGLPRDVAGYLEFEHVTQILNGLSEFKKKIAAQGSSSQS